MRREILFKAKRKNWRELPKEEWWVEGYVIPDEITGQFFIHARWNSVNESYKIGEEGYLRFVAYEVDSETLCQYTGLTDKNGIKIWENDILRYSYDYPGSIWLKTKRLTDADIKYSVGAVFWQEYRGTWAVCRHGKKRMTNQDVFTYCRNPNRVEIVGNIFDNPELLEVEHGTINRTARRSCCDKR